MGTSDYKNFLQSIFWRGQGAQTFDTVVSVGGVNDSSSSITYDVNHYDSSGALRVSGISSQTGTWTAQFQAEARTTDKTPVANGASVTVIADSIGKQVVIPGAVNDLHLDGAVQQAGIIATALIANQGSGKKIALQSLLVTCSGSATAQVIISGGPNNRTFGFASPGGGFTIAAGGAALYITSASTALSVNADVTSTMDIFASGYSLGN